jgi:phosphatidylglycerol:prolipoprotein diacylglycerol transferase
MDWRYSAVMLLAVAAGAWLARRRQAALRLPPGHRLGLAVGAFCGALLGAKLPFLLADWSHLASGRGWLLGEKTILAGLVGGYAGVEAAKWALDVRVKTGDSFALPVAVSLAIGRLACFVGGCCYGCLTQLPWGVDFLGDGVARHPTQLYEAAFHAALALVLLLLEDRGVWPGQRLKFYFLCYFAFRFASEWLRPAPPLAAGLTGYQWACLVLAPVFAWLWWRDRRKLSAPDPGIARLGVP